VTDLYPVNLWYPCESLVTVVMVRVTDLYPVNLWYPCESLVAAGRAYGQHCCRASVKVLPVLVDTFDPLDKGVSDIKFWMSDVLAVASE